jgi:hypothetical protein
MLGQRVSACALLAGFVRGATGASLESPVEIKQTSTTLLRVKQFAPSLSAIVGTLSTHATVRGPPAVQMSEERR